MAERVLADLRGLHGSAAGRREPRRCGRPGAYVPRHAVPRPPRAKDHGGDTRGNDPMLAVPPRALGRPAVRVGPPGQSPANCGVTVYRYSDAAKRLDLEEYNHVYWTVGSSEDGQQPATAPQAAITLAFAFSTGPSGSRRRARRGNASGQGSRTPGLSRPWKGRRQTSPLALPRSPRPSATARASASWLALRRAPKRCCRAAWRRAAAPRR